MYEFEKSDGTKISIEQYYKQKYNKDIKEKNQPLLVQHRVEKDSTGKEIQKPDCYFVPEFMSPTGD